MYVYLKFKLYLKISSINTCHLLTESEVIARKSQTKALTAGLIFGFHVTEKTKIKNFNFLILSGKSHF